MTDYIGFFKVGNMPGIVMTENGGMRLVLS